MRFKMESQNTADMLRQEQDASRAVRAQEASGQATLKRHIQECNKLRSEKESLAKRANKQGLELNEVKFRLTSAEGEVKQAMEIVSGKPFCSSNPCFGWRSFPKLANRCFLSVYFPDLSTSAARACHFYNGSVDAAHGHARLFWHPFQDPTRSVALGEKLQQLGELHKLAMPAMEEVFKVLLLEKSYWETSSTSLAVFGSHVLGLTCGWCRQPEKVLVRHGGCCRLTILM